MYRWSLVSLSLCGWQHDNGRLAVATTLFATGTSHTLAPKFSLTRHQLPACRHTFKHKWLVDEALTHCSWPGSGTRCYQVSGTKGRWSRPGPPVGRLVCGAAGQLESISAPLL